MNSRERVELALDHREADRIPIDLGGAIMTSIHRDAYAALRSSLGLPQKPIRIANLVMQLVAIDEDIREQVGADVTEIDGQPPANAQTIQIKDDLPDYTYFYDEWGIGWKMPKNGGFYYDVFHHPLGGEVSCAEIERYPWIDPVDPARFNGVREQVLQARAQGQAVIVGGVSAGFVEMAGWLRGYEEYLMDIIDNPKRLECLFDKILELKLAFWDRMLEEVGDIATGVMESDDLGTQQDLLFSPKAYRELVKPYHRKVCDFIHSRTKAKIFFHSCGAIRSVLPDLIQVGVDILNPVQVNAAGMDSALLKRAFGKDLAFWGGGVDTQRILPFGTPQQVKDEVKRRIDDLAPGGGFVFATVHAVQANVPPENVVAVWEAFKEHCCYGH